MSEFKITGPGEYRTRVGKRITVVAIVDALSQPVIAIDHVGDADNYSLNGAYHTNGSTSHLDIIGPWVETAAEPKPAEQPKTLRDEMAMAALPALITHEHYEKNLKTRIEGKLRVCEKAYAWADFMMAARSKK